MANTGQFKHLDQDQAWAYVHAAKCGDESGLKVVSAWSNEAKCELAAVGLFGRRQDEQDFRSCLEYYTEGGLPPTWPVDDVQRGLEKLGVPDRSPPQPQPAQPATSAAATPSPATPTQPAQPQVATPSPAPPPQPAPSDAAPPSPAPGWAGLLAAGRPVVPEWAALPAAGRAGVAAEKATDRTPRAFRDRAGHHRRAMWEEALPRCNTQGTTENPARPVSDRTDPRLPARIWPRLTTR